MHSGGGREEKRMILRLLECLHLHRRGQRIRSLIHMLEMLPSKAGGYLFILGPNVYFLSDFLLSATKFRGYCFIS